MTNTSQIDATAKDRFREFVTGAQFQMTLSKQQVLAMEALAEGNSTALNFAGTGTLVSLERKGLVTAFINERHGMQWELSDVGRLLLPLLEAAGMFEPNSAFKNKSMREIIAELNAGGMSQVAIAQYLGIHKSNVSRALKRARS